MYGILMSVVLIIVLVVFFWFFRYSESRTKKKEKSFIDSHRKIRPGMGKLEVLAILGEEYTQSYLQNDIEKLEWQYRQAGVGVLLNGLFVSEDSYTRRISVFFKNDFVIEVHSFNMD